MTDELKAALEQLAEAKNGGDAEEIATAQVRVSMFEAAGKAQKEKASDAVDPHELELIEGVGDVTAGKLREAGVTTIGQVARMSEARAEELGLKEESISSAKKLVG